MNEDNEDDPKESENSSKKKISYLSFSDNSLLEHSHLLRKSNSKVESNLMDNKDELGILLIKAAKEPFDGGQEVKRLLDLKAPVNYQEKTQELPLFI